MSAISSSASKRTLVDDSSDNDEYRLSSSTSKPKIAPLFNASKRPKIASNVLNADEILSLSRSALSERSKENLVDYVVTLQEAVKAKAGLKVVSPEEEKKALEIQRALMVKGISKQMGWKPSCKTGSAKFSHVLFLSYTQFLSLFSLEGGKKVRKAVKLTHEEFEKACGNQRCPTASVRYDSLSVKGAVNLRWDEEAGTCTVNGTYGTGWCGGE